MNSARLPEEKFLYAAIIITLTAGSGLGAWLLVNAIAGGTYGSHMGTVLQVHARAQLFGWVGLFIMGMAYVILPRFKATPLYSVRLLNISFWLVLTGLLSWIAWQIFDIRFTPALYLPPALEAAGAGMFVYNLWQTLKASGNKDIWDRWIKAGLLWLFGLTVSGLWLLPRIAGAGRLPDNLIDTYYNLFIYGFILNFIFGVGIRTIPAFMGARQAEARIINPVYWVYNLALSAQAIIWLIGADAAGAVTSLRLVVIAAIAAFIYAINIFRRPETNLGEEFALETSYMNYIPAAYFWLTVGLAIEAISLLLGSSFARSESISLAATHAITVGFISMMIFGYATKAVPVFKGRRLFSPVLNNVTFMIINFGTAMRVVSQLTFGVGNGALVAVLAASGIVQLTAFTLFAYNIARTTFGAVAEEEEELEDFAAVSGNTIVADILDRHPETLEIFLRFGFTPLTNPVGRRTIAKAVTLAAAARMKNVDLNELLGSINDCLENHDNGLRAV